MRLRLGRLPRFFIAVTIAFHWAFPVIAAPSFVPPISSTTLLPVWFTGGDRAADRPAPSAAMLPTRHTGAGLARGITAQAATTLTITKSDAPDPVDQGHLLSYVITVTNRTTETAQQVIVTDTTPAGTVFESAGVLDSGGTTWFYGGPAIGESGDFIWFTGDRIGIGDGLPGGSTAVLKFVVRVMEPFPDQSLLHNDAYYADAANADLVQGADVTTVVNAPAFTLGKVASSDPITAGQRLTYTIHLTNTGHLTTSLPYTIVETLPAHTLYAGSSPPAQVTGDTLTWTLSAPLGVGQVDQVTFAVTVTAPLTDGLSLVNDDYLAFSEEVTPTAAGPALSTDVRSWPLLSMTKSDQPDPTVAGGTIGYTLVVTNSVVANGPAQGLVVTDRVPLSTTLLAAPGATWSGTGPGSLVTWTLPSFLWPGETATFAFTVTVSSPMVSGTLILNDDYGATAANALVSTLGDPVTTTVQSYPDLRLVKTARPALLTPNDPVTFTLVFSNVGGTGAAGVVVTDTLPVSLTSVGWAGTPNVSLQTAAHPHYTWTVTPLDPGEGGVITLTARVMTTTAWGQSTLLTNRARIATTDTDVQPDNNADQTSVTVVPGPAAQVSLSAVPAAASVDCSVAVTGTVLDTWGNPVADGTVVTFTTSTGASSISPAFDTTLGGEAHATLTSTRPGPVVVTGTVGTGAFDTVAVGFTPGSPVTFLFAPIADQAAGVPFTIIFTATDQYGNVATGFTGPASLADETGTLSPSTSQPAVNGVLTQSVAVAQAWAANRITATAWVTPDCGAPHWAVGESAAFTVTHGTAVALSLSPARATVPAGTDLAYTAVATDASGNGWDATAEVAYVASGGNTFPGTPPGNNVLSATVVGVNLPVTGTLGGVQAVAYVTVTHGAAVQLALSPPVTMVVAGTLVSYTAVATDAFGNGWDATADATYVASGGNAFPGPTPGNHVLSATVAGTWSLTGTLGSVHTTATITVTSAPADQFVFAPIGTQTAGAGFTVVITAVDRFGNVAAGFASTISLADTTGTLSPTSWGSWTGGVASFTAVITRSWSGDVITATAVATPALSGASAPFDVVGGAPFSLVYTTPASLRLCERAPVTVTVTDRWGNPVSDGTVVTLTSDGVRLWFLESGTFDYYPTTSGGVATATLVAGSTASPPDGWTRADAGVASSGYNWIEVASPGVPYTVDVVAEPNTIAAFTETTVITATVYDCAASPNRLSGETVNFAANFGTLNPLWDVTDVNGEATTTYSSTQAGTALITATAGEAYGVVQITVTPPERQVYLPLVMSNYRGVNLVVESIVVEPASPAPGEPVVVTVTVRNTGPTAIGTSFWVDLYLDPSGTPAPGVRWDEICDEGVAWHVMGLGGGRSLTLRSDQGAPAYTYWSGSFAATPDPHRLYAVADVWPGPPGAIQEDREEDNVLGPVNIPMGP